MPRTRKPQPPAAAPAQGTDESLRAEFAASPDLQKQYREVEIYLAYKKAEAAGQVKRFSKQPE